MSYLFRRDSLGRDFLLGIGLLRRHRVSGILRETIQSNNRQGNHTAGPRVEQLQRRHTHAHTTRLILDEPMREKVSLGTPHAPSSLLRFVL